MAKTLIHSFILNTILIAAAMVASSDAAEAPPNFHIFPRVHAKVWDNLPAEAEQIHMRCKSGNDDLGYKFLKPDTAYEWDFAPNIWETTLFYCTVESAYGRLVFNAYDFYRDMRTVKRCRTACNWSVRVDGIHGVNQETNLEDLFFPWVK